MPIPKVTIIMIVGFNMGMVIFVTCFHFPAPSNSAAS